MRQISSGETRHARNPPMEEAQLLYVDQSHLTERLRLSASATTAMEQETPLVIWDVGLGAAANAMAAIRCYEDAALTGPVRPMQIVSFERDLDALRLAFAYNSREFPYLRHAAPAGLLQQGRWQSRQYSGLGWTLVAGDFLETMSAAATPPDVIFYDPFSSSTNKGLWSLDTFRRLFEVCGNRAVELFSYTGSTATRAALLAAGFYVAKGRPIGDRAETTVSFTAAALVGSYAAHCELLSAAWLERWQRSSARLPATLPIDEQSAFEQAVATHPQFLLA